MKLGGENWAEKMLTEKREACFRERCDRGIEKKARGKLCSWGVESQEV